MLTAEKPRKFETLDALRGLAAALVVIHHFKILFGNWLLPHLFLAVDFFYCLSGFVLSHAYQKRLDAGLPTVDFMRSRYIRLWPIYIIGMALGVFAFFAYHTPLPMYAFFPNLLLLPAFSHDHDIGLFRFNGPTWTLFFELLANLVHAVFLRRIRTDSLAALTAGAGALLLAGCIFMNFLDGGWSVRSCLPLGVPRVLFSYLLGMLCYRIWKRHLQYPKISAFLPVFLLLAVLLGRLPSRFEPTYLVLTLTVLFPLILLAGACSTPGGRQQISFTALGLASYAIYVMHEPLGFLWLVYWPQIFGSQAGKVAPWSGFLLLLTLFASALVLDRVYDRPVRKWLERLVKSKQRTRELAKS